MKSDIYERVTSAIVAELEKGVKPWLKPWNAEHAAGRITRPLRSGGIPQQGINVVMLWSEAVSKGYAAPIWMTFRQALELGGHVRKCEKGSLVVYASLRGCQTGSLFRIYSRTLVRFARCTISRNESGYGGG